AHHRDSPSFPTRRSSDLLNGAAAAKRIDEAIRRLPGMQWFNMLSSRLSATLAAAQPSDLQALQSPWKVATGYLKHPPQHVEQERSEEHTSELQSRFDLVC